MSLPPLVEPVDALSADESARTARHLALAGFGEASQRRLAGAHVALVGAGGLGAPAILALAAAGVGTLTVIDDDVVEVSNLQRQVLHRTADIGRPKADSAVRVAADLSPTTVVRPLLTRLDASNAEELLSGADVVLDGADTFATRVDVAAACERLGVPLVWGVIQEFAAQLTVFWSRPPAGRAPVVLGDLYPAGAAGEPPSCAQVGVLGALCLQVGSAMAMQAIQLICGIGEPLLGRLLLIDSLRSTQREVPLVGSGAAAPSAPPAPPRPAAASLPAAELDAFLAGDGARLLLDVREPAEIADDDPFPGSVRIPIGDVLADPGAAVRRLGTAADVAVVCLSGVRSRRAADALAAAGLACASVAGGITAWRSAGAPAPTAAREAAAR